jgi:hypothetical protein
MCTAFLFSVSWNDAGTSGSFGPNDNSSANSRQIHNSALHEGSGKTAAHSRDKPWNSWMRPCQTARRVATNHTHVRQVKDVGARFRRRAEATAEVGLILPERAKKAMGNGS